MNRISHWLLSWFVKRILRSEIEKKNLPGNISAHIGVGSIGRPVRKTFMPEKLFVKIENAAVERHGEEAEDNLYSAGKRMGRRFNEISDFPTIDEVGGFRMKRFFNFFATYVETVYADRIEYSMDFEKKRLELKFEGMSVCRKTGKGDIFSKGIPSGAISHLYNRQSMTAMHPECQGRGDEKCRTVVEPDNLQKISGSETLSDMYDERNSTDLFKGLQGSSLEDMTATEDYRFMDGILEVKGERHLIEEICLPFLLEDEFSSQEGRETLFQASKAAGQEIFEGADTDFIEKYLTATGWGVLEMREDEIIARHFPWTYLNDSTDFIIFRGFLSGLLSDAEHREVELREYDYEDEESRLRIPR